VRGKLRRVGQYLEDRTGVGAMVRRALDEEVEGGARWAHGFGSALAVLFVLEAVTGALLMMHYTPSVDGAWSSTFWIQHEVINGWFVRGLHHYGAQAMLVVLGLHFLQVVLYGAYKKPREVTWWLGLGMMGLVLGLLITGLRLPWDQHSYWALQVELNIAGATPGVGETMTELVAGGPRIGQSTVTRLYALHVAILPALLVLLFVAHYALVRRHGRTPPEGAPATKAPLYPGQVLRDLGFVLLVLAAVAILTAATGGVTDLTAPAEPGRNFPARPEWFLLPLFQLRKMMPAGSGELVATLVVPGVAALFLFALPFLDRKESRRVRGRLHLVVPILLGVAGMGVLTYVSRAKDAADEDHQEAMAEARKRADRAVELARSGIPPEGPVAMLWNDPLTRGPEVYEQYCSSCHVLNGEGEREAPDHTGYGSREWVVELLHGPWNEHFFGNTDLEEEMPSQARLGEERIAALAEFLFSQGHEPQDAPDDEELAAEGETIFRDKCLRCHTYGNEGDFMGVGGPNLRGWASRTWIFRQTEDPGSPRNYGTLNDMPAFAGQLSERDIRMVTAYLRLQRFEEPDFEVPRDDGD